MLAAIGQLLAVALVTIRCGPFRGSSLRLAACVAAADFPIWLLLVAVTAALRSVDYGGEHRQAAVSLAHLAISVAIPWFLWSCAVDLGAARSVPWSGGLVLLLTVVGLTAPGVRSPWSHRAADVDRIAVPVRNLPKALDGLRIVLVSDTHVGPYISLTQARARLAPLPSLDADLIVFAGDLASDRPVNLYPAAALLDEMAPKGTRFAILGNHDHYTDARLAAFELREHHFDVLINDHRRVRVRGTDLWVVGVDDPYTGWDDIKRALAGVPDDAFVILLSHTPDIVGEAPAARANLILSGHTHGGQVVLPLVGPLTCNSRYGSRYAAGLFRIGAVSLFVTRGLGEVTVPLRVFCPPEIAVLTLKSAGD